MAYGAPCIQLVRLGGRELFTIRVVIAEVESGEPCFPFEPQNSSTNKTCLWCVRLICSLPFSVQALRCGKE